MSLNRSDAPPRWTSVPRLALIALAVLASAAASADEHAALVDALYAESGLEAQVRGIPDQVVAGLPRDFEGDGGALAAGVIAEEAQRAFSPESMGEAIRAELVRALGADDVARSLEWLRTPLGRRITRMEEDAATAESFAEMMTYGQTLQASPPDEARVARIDRLMAATLGVEVATSAVLNMQMAIITGVAAATPGRGPAILSSAVEALEAERSQVEQLMRTQVRVGGLYTYREASNADLDGYIEFAMTATGERYHQAVFTAFERAMVHASERFGRAVARALRGGAA